MNEVTIATWENLALAFTGFILPVMLLGVGKLLFRLSKGQEEMSQSVQSIEQAIFGHPKAKEEGMLAEVTRLRARVHDLAVHVQAVSTEIENIRQDLDNLMERRS